MSSMAGATGNHPSCLDLPASVCEGLGGGRQLNSMTCAWRELGGECCRAGGSDGETLVCDRENVALRVQAQPRWTNNPILSSLQAALPPPTVHLKITLPAQGQGPSLGRRLLPSF